jgi:hypothetical protein
MVSRVHSCGSAEARTVRRVAVRLDVRRVLALESRRAGRELQTSPISFRDRARTETGATHAGRLARADVVREALDVARITHENRSGHLFLGCSGERDGGARDAVVRVAAAAVRVVEDLAALRASQRRNG